MSREQRRYCTASSPADADAADDARTVPRAAAGTVAWLVVSHFHPSTFSCSPIDSVLVAQIDCILPRILTGVT